MWGKLAISTGIVGAAVAGLAWWVLRGDLAAPFGDDPILSRVARSGPKARPRDYFAVIERPDYLTVESAAESMSDDEVVLGIEIAGEVRAYPTNYLNDHEMVREEIGGTALLVTW